MSQDSDNKQETRLSLIRPSTWISDEKKAMLQELAQDHGEEMTRMAKWFLLWTVVIGFITGSFWELAFFNFVIWWIYGLARLRAHMDGELKVMRRYSDHMDKYRQFLLEHIDMQNRHSEACCHLVDGGSDLSVRVVNAYNSLTGIPERLPNPSKRDPDKPVLVHNLDDERKLH